MELNNNREEEDRKWVEESEKDPWFIIYRCAYERWEYYKKVDPDRAAREYESMLTATALGTWWKKWN